jgi:hypothetical protein
MAAYECLARSELQLITPPSSHMWMALPPCDILGLLCPITGHLSMHAGAVLKTSYIS